MVSPSMEADYESMRKWTLFFSVLGFIGAGIMAIAGLGIMFSGFGGLGFMGIIYIALGLLYFMPSLWGTKVNSQIKLALLNKDQNALNTGVSKQKLIHKFFGILTIVMMALYFVMFMIGGAGMFMGGIGSF